MSLIEALGYVCLSVSDMVAWRQFAGNVLGLQEVPRTDGAVDLRMDGHAMRVRLSPGAADDIVCAGWELRDRNALAQLADRLQQAGIPVTGASAAEAAERHVRELIHFSDPEGLRLDAYWGPLVLSDQPFISPRGVRFKTGPQGLGHIVLVSQDAAAQQRFYGDVLGFRVSDYIDTEVVPGRPISITFMRCNSRHHSLALAQLPLKKKLQHMMIEVQSVDDVGRTLYRCMDAGIHISLTLGRHSNDDMLSFYPMSPSGFDIEYGWAGIAIDEATWTVVTHHTNSAWGHRFQRPPRPPKPDEGR